MIVLIMTIQVLSFNVFARKDLHLNAVELWNKKQDQAEKSLDDELLYPLVLLVDLRSDKLCNDNNKKEIVNFLFE